MWTTNISAFSNQAEISQTFAHFFLLILA